MGRNAIEVTVEDAIDYTNKTAIKNAIENAIRDTIIDAFGANIDYWRPY